MTETLKYQPHYRRNLPHIQPPGATFFVTCRLAGSLPRAVIDELRDEAKRAAAALKSLEDDEKRAKREYEELKRQFGRWDAALDTASSGPHWLTNRRVAQMVVEAIHYREGDVYELHAFCIMSNHIHLVFAPLVKPDGSYHALSSIMHSLKLYTARSANRILGRHGRFWQPESYDHVIRDRKEWERIIRYVVLNPVRAGLVEQWEHWPWTYCLGA